MDCDSYDVIDHQSMATATVVLLSPPLHLSYNGCVEATREDN